MNLFFRLAVLVLSLVLVASACAGTAEEDWQAVLALDAGPLGRSTTTDELPRAVLQHLARQEAALRAFLTAHPTDTRVFEAKLRLARLFEIRAELGGPVQLRAEAKRLLDELEKTATPEQRPELEFSQVARLMRSMQGAGAGQREELLSAARHFQRNYPADRRIASLLTEVATLFDAQPVTKEALLEDAQAVASNDDLKARIADDLKRTRMLGHEVSFKFTSLQGQEISSEALLGKPLFLIFFAGFSPPSIAAVAKLADAVAELPAGSVRVVGVSLDAKRETALAILKGRKLAWPLAFDGKGWEGPLVRNLGINGLPTVWLLDSRGRLRSLNALEGAVPQVRQLLLEH